VTYSILAPTRYPWTFNGPRASRHSITRRAFAPFGKLSEYLEGVTIMNPFPIKRFDLVHAFNRIPLGTTPFVIGFESHLPRVINREDGKAFALQTRLLLSDRCRAIIPFSKIAERWFRRVHGQSSFWPELEAKLYMRYPNVPVFHGQDALQEEAALREQDALQEQDHGPVRLAFVGSHFGRKGGCVAVRIAELALQRNRDIEVTIVSNLTVGGSVWTDPTRPEFFDRYRALLDLPNVTLFRQLPNDEVVDLLRRSHFTLLPTFGDTFGFTAIESMMSCTPVIATDQGALPEFIVDDENGILLDLETTEFGSWVESHKKDRSSAAFERRFTDEVDRLAEEALDRITRLLSSPREYFAMRRSAHETAVTMFGAEDASRFWDSLYEVAIAKQDALERREAMRALSVPQPALHRNPLSQRHSR